MTLKNNYGLYVLTTDELMELALSIPILPEHRLKPTWAYIQNVKYNAMIENGDCMQPNYIFQHAELPLIKRLYPPEEVNKKVTLLMKFLKKHTSLHSQNKFKEYIEMRRYGLSIDTARKKLQPYYPEQMLIRMSLKYNLPCKFKYELSCRDADVLYGLGINSFIKLFYDRFYVPINN